MSSRETCGEPAFGRKGASWPHLAPSRLEASPILETLPDGTLRGALPYRELRVDGDHMTIARHGDAVFPQFWFAKTCLPRTCDEANLRCGRLLDGCGHVASCGDCAGVTIPDGPVSLVTTADVSFDAKLAYRRPGKKATPSYCDGIAPRRETRTPKVKLALTRDRLGPGVTVRAYLQDGGDWALGTWSIAGTAHPLGETSSSFLVGWADEAKKWRVAIEGYVRAKHVNGRWELLHEGAVTALHTDMNRNPDQCEEGYDWEGEVAFHVEEGVVD